MTAVSPPTAKLGVAGGGASSTWKSLDPRVREPARKPALETDQSQPGSARLRAGTADGASADSSRLPGAESSWSEPQHEQARSTAGSGPPRPRHHCWLPPPTPSVARLLAPASLGSGVGWGPGRQPRARAFWARQAIPRTTLPSPVVGIRFLRFPPSMPRDSRAPPWPGSGAQLRLQRPGWLRPHCAADTACGRCDGRPRRDRGFGM